MSGRIVGGGLVGAKLKAIAVVPAVRFDEDRFWMELDDGRTLGVPLAWFPRLLHASPQARSACEISRRGLHWEALDVGISIAGLLQGPGPFQPAGMAA